MRKEIDIILAKGFIDSADFEKLAKLQQFLTQEEKVRLGFAPVVAPIIAPVVVKESSPETPILAKVKRVIKKKVV